MGIPEQPQSGMNIAPDGTVYEILDDGTIKRIGKVSPDGSFEPFGGTKDGIREKNGIIYRVINGKEVKIGRILPNGEIETINQRIKNEAEISRNKVKAATIISVCSLLAFFVALYAMQQVWKTREYDYKVKPVYSRYLDEVTPTSESLQGYINQLDKLIKLKEVKYTENKRKIAEIIDEIKAKQAREEAKKTEEERKAKEADAKKAEEARKAEQAKAEQAKAEQAKKAAAVAEPEQTGNGSATKDATGEQQAHAQGSSESSESNGNDHGTQGVAIKPNHTAGDNETCAKFLEDEAYTNALADYNDLKSGKKEKDINIIKNHLKALGELLNYGNLKNCKEQKTKIKLLRNKIDPKKLSDALKKDMKSKQCNQNEAYTVLSHIKWNDKEHTETWKKYEEVCHQHKPGKYEKR